MTCNVFGGTVNLTLPFQVFLQLKKKQNLDFSGLKKTLKMGF